jgi:N-acetylmuramoyl-L-alanine amidase
MSFKKLPLVSIFNSTICVVIWAVSPTVLAEQYSITTNFNSENFEATMYIVPLEKEEYVSLESVIEQLGGMVSVTPTRVRIDLAGTIAWLNLNDTRVSSISIFSLDKPVINHNENIFIGVTDLSPLLRKAFRIEVTSEERLGDPKTVPEESTTAIGKTPLVNTKNTLQESRPKKAIRAIVIDAAHGGFDEGIEGATGYLEKNFSLAMALKLKSEFEKQLSVPIYMTRDSDRNLSRASRIEFTNQYPDSLYISIQTGGSLSPSLSGYSLVYNNQPENPNRTPLVLPSDDESKVWCQWIAPYLERSLPIPNRGIMGLPERTLGGIIPAAIILELGYLTNPSEETLLRLDSNQGIIAKTIVMAVKNSGSLNRSFGNDSSLPPELESTRILEPSGEFSESSP